jgi:hypothetical protein
MRSLAAAFVTTLAALALGGVAHAATTFGVADDAGKYATDGGAGFFRGMNSVGLVTNRITVQWDPAHPTRIVEQAFLDRSLPQALARNINVLFALYPTRADALTANPNGPAQFAAWAQQLARRYPQVTDYTVGNEPNKSYFWRPQFAADGTPVAAATFLPVLAGTYDALKAVNPAIRVYGVGLSERGNDNAQAESNVSTSPIRFLRDLGAAYRASGRKAPIMDELVVHPYPEAQSDELTKSYAWPSAGYGNLDRVKQAVWDAFDGTAQPTVESGLKLRIGEIGWQSQALEAAAKAYSGKETVAAASEGHQAKVYGDVVRLSACDPAISSVYFFGLVDEPQLDRWQAGLLRANYSAKPSYHIVREEITRARSGCAGTPTTWQHTTKVVGAVAKFGRLDRAFPTRQKAWAFSVTAEEEATYRAGIVPVTGTKARAPQAARKSARRAVAEATGTIRARWTPRVKFPAKRLKPGRYAYTVEIVSTMNPARKTVLVSAPFRVGAPAK